MIDAIKAAQIAMLEDQERLQTISLNISNMQTAGYKRQLLEAGSFDEHLRADAASISQHMDSAQMLNQGTLMQTDNTKDIALAGDGFIEVQTKEGTFYSRRGDLHVNEQGQLSAATGGLIMGQSGPIQVDDNEFKINTQGTIYIDNRKIDQLNIVHFEPNQSLKYRGQGLYETQETPAPALATTRVLQGFIEQSNVKSVDEMMEMIKTSRHYEASQRVMHIADGLLSTAINQLGEGNV
ncbi:MAG: flagellar hook basal-body protein [Tatlockia sp.]|nr:flagellar hook basal-body protein [Tatlockia sp.]